MNLWEPPAKLYSEINQPHDWAIVLAGITDPNKLPTDRIHFNKGADRIIHAIDLYKAGKVKKIIIAGGSGVLTYEGKKESHALGAFAIACGVPKENVILEDQSRNTRENALFSAEIVKKDQSVILFTSAFHMKRASNCFKKLGIKVTTFPTDYYGDIIRFTPADIIVPKYQSLQFWSILIKEWVGITAYRIVGYI